MARRALSNWTVHARKLRTAVGMLACQPQFIQGQKTSMVLLANGVRLPEAQQSQVRSEVTLTMFVRLPLLTVCGCAGVCSVQFCAEIDQHPQVAMIRERLVRETIGRHAVVKEVAISFT